MSIKEDWESLDDSMKECTKEKLLQTIAMMSDREAIELVALVVQDLLDDMKKMEKQNGNE